MIERNGQAYVVRGIGVLNNVSEIEDIIITKLNNVPILVKNIATVVTGGRKAAPGLGFKG